MPFLSTLETKFSPKSFNLFNLLRYFTTIKIEKAKFKKSEMQNEVEEEKEPETKTCPYCLSEIKYKATKCPNCTSTLEEIKTEKV